MQKDSQKRSKPGSGIGFRGSISLVNVRAVKYVREYERPFICRLSVSPCSTPPSRPPRVRLPSVSGYEPPRTGCSPFLSRSNLTRMAAMHTHGSIRTDLPLVDAQDPRELLKLPTRLANSLPNRVGQVCELRVDI